MTRRVTVGDREICYELTRKKVKNINLRIHPDGRITVSASVKVPETVIDQFILKKAGFIFNALDRFEQIRPCSAVYEDGGKLPFFGRELTVRLLVSSKRRAELNGDQLCILRLENDEGSAVKKLVEDFMRDELEKRLSQIVPATYERFGFEPSVELSDVKVRKMRSRWGSCNCKTGAITLNLHLAEYPTDAIEFVVVHELCHLFHPDHSKAFYALLSSVMPDWKRRKEMLNRR